MTKLIAVALAAGLVLSSAGLAAHAQETPELEGAPGTRGPAIPPPLKVPPKSVPKAPTTTTGKTTQTSSEAMKAAQAKLAKQADIQKAEQVRLAKQADDLKAQQATLDAKAAQIAADEQRLAKLREDAAARQAELDQLTADHKRLAKQQADEQAKLAADRAELDRQADAARQAALARSTDREEAADADVEDESLPRTDRSLPPRLMFAAARRACGEAGADEAFARRFNDAQYDGEPRLYRREGWEMRGRMRLEDRRRGYLVVDTLCRLNEAGEVQDFALLR